MRRPPSRVPRLAPGRLIPCPTTASSFNLRSDTFAEPFRESIPTPAYLLAADHATPGMRDLASGVPDQGLDPFADNVNFELIGKTEAHFRDRAREVLQKVRTAEDALGHRARRGDLPDGYRVELKELGG